MPKQQKESTRLDNLPLGPLAAAGLKHKEQIVPNIPEPVPEGANSLSEPSNPIAETPARQGGRPTKEDEKKATEKVTAYFTPEQYDKIEELRRAHRKKTKKRISVNELLRRLVAGASIEDIL